MKIIGLTGGIASGKSSVADMIRKLGYPVVCADELAHDAIRPGKEAYQNIVRTFGVQILKNDKTIDRDVLGSIVFADKTKRKQLNDIVHPAVMEGIRKTIVKNKEKAQKLIVVDVPLLYEEGIDKQCDEIIVVYAPKKVMSERLRTRNRLDETEIKNRLASQMSIEEKKKRAQHVIDNAGNLENTRKQVEKLFRQMTDSR